MLLVACTTTTPIPQKHAGVLWAMLAPAVPYVCLALIAALYLIPFLRILTWNPDEGIYLYGAQLVTQGAIPSRDFVELQGPGSFYWLALFFKLFGTSLLTARALLLVTGSATAVLAFHLSRRLGASGLPAALFVLTTSIPLGVMNSPHYDSNLFGLIAVELLIASLARPDALDRRVGWLLYVAGAMAGVTTCILQQKGSFLLASFVLTVAALCRHGRVRRCALLLAGYLTVFGSELAFYIGHNALGYLLYGNVLWPLTTYTSVNKAPYGFTLRESWWPAWFSVLHSNFPTPVAFLGTAALSVPYVFILAVPAILAACAVTAKNKVFTKKTIPYWAAGVALWCAELHRWDLGHLRNGSVLLIILLLSVCETTLGRIGRHVVLIVSACVVLNGAANIVGAAAQNQAQLETRRGTISAPKADDALRFLLSHTKPGDDLFVYPYQPIYYFIADMRNPVRFSNLMYHINTDAQFRECVHRLDSKHVQYVLWDSQFSGANLKALFPAYEHPAADKLIMEPYLTTHYHQIGLANGFRILERNR